MCKPISFIWFSLILAGTAVACLILPDAIEGLHSTPRSQINAFGPALVGLLITVAGLCGILSSTYSNSKLGLFYPISTTISAVAAAAAVWIFGLKWCSACDVAAFTNCDDTKETKDAFVTCLTFSCVSVMMSILGLIVNCFNRRTEKTGKPLFLSMTEHYM